MLEKWKELIIVPIFKKGDKTECSNNIRISQGLISYKHLPNILLWRLTPNAEELKGIISVDFDAAGQILIMYSTFVKYFRKFGNTINQCIIDL